MASVINIGPGPSSSLHGGGSAEADTNGQAATEPAGEPISRRTLGAGSRSALTRPTRAPAIARPDHRSEHMSVDRLCFRSRSLISHCVGAGHEPTTCKPECQPKRESENCTIDSVSTTENGNFLPYLIIRTKTDKRPKS